MHEEIAMDFILGSKDIYFLLVQQLVCDQLCFTLNLFLEWLHVPSDFCISYFLLWLLQNILQKHLQEGTGYFVSVFEGTDHHNGDCGYKSSPHSEGKARIAWFDGPKVKKPKHECWCST